MKEILTSNVLEATKKLKARISRDLDTSSAIDKPFKEDPVLKEILEGYTLYTHPEHKGHVLDKYVENLKEDIIEYIEDNKCEYSVKTLVLLAYFRLTKTSKKYYLQKTYSEDSKILAKLNKQAKEAYAEYKLIACLL